MPLLGAGSTLVALYAAAPVRGVQWTVGPIEVDDHDANLEGIRTLAMCSATMEETLAFFSSEPNGKLRITAILHCPFNQAWAQHSGFSAVAGTVVLDRNMFV